ncbi:MAG: hypothetical protein AAB546_01435 [Patescibacteria group bacterium]
MGKLPADIEQVRSKLKLKNLEAKQKFQVSFPHAHQYLLEKGLDLSKIRDYSSKLLTTSVLAGSLLFSPAGQTKMLPSPLEIVNKFQKDTADNSVPAKKQLIESLNSILPDRPRPLSQDEEKFLEQVFDGVLGIKAKATLEGEHLNTTYGYIGAEQHLRRYPGDSVANHMGYSSTVLKEGIAPGLGAWGYFAPSKEALSDDLVDTEKWYAVVQTLYLPDWARRQPYLRDWYKYRKVLILNTVNGNAVVAAVADSGPAAWTGKHYGGSPEVMEYLGGSKYKKGKVILFFVDDPQNKVQLGPVDYNQIERQNLIQV